MKNVAENVSKAIKKQKKSKEINSKTKQQMDFYERMVHLGIIRKQEFNLSSGRQFDKDPHDLPKHLVT